MEMTQTLGIAEREYKTFRKQNIANKQKILIQLNSSRVINHFQVDKKKQQHKILS